MRRFETAKTKIWESFLMIAFQTTVFVGAILLVEAGTRAHKYWKRKHGEDAPNSL